LPRYFILIITQSKSIRVKFNEDRCAPNGQAGNIANTGGLTGGQVEGFGNLVQRVFELGQQKGAGGKLCDMTTCSDKELSYMIKHGSRQADESRNMP